MNGQDNFKVRIYIPKKERGSLLAYASVNVCGVFAVDGVRLVKGKEGPFVAMPARKYNGEWQDICFPCTKEARAALDQAVIGAYDQAMKEQETEIINKLGTMHGPEMNM